MRKFVIILLLNIPPHIKCVARLRCEMSSVLKATIENKTTSEVKRHSRIVTKFFINEQNFKKPWSNANDIGDDVTRHRQKSK